MNTLYSLYMKRPFLEHHLFQLLERYSSHPLPLDLLLRHYFQTNKALGSKDRHYLADTAYQLIRWELLVNYLGGKDLSWDKKHALFLQLQPHTRKADPALPLHIQVSFPEELFTELSRGYGREGALELCGISNTEAPLYVRVNPLKSTREELMRQWGESYQVTPCLHSPYGVQFHKREPLTSFPEFKEGSFEIQDEASQQVALLLRAEPGDKVLDYCAGSGGKTLAFAHRLQQQGQIYLHDIRTSILLQARKRLKRAGIQNSQCLPSDHPTLPKLKQKMDWVLADVPCSGTGTLRRNPDQKYKFSATMMTRLIGEQRTIFEKALSYVKPGGKIIYATCSILPTENADQVAHFLATYPLTLVEEPFSSLPTRGGADGFFAALFCKKL